MRDIREKKLKQLNKLKTFFCYWRRKYLSAVDEKPFFIIEYKKMERRGEKMGKKEQTCRHSYIEWN